MKIKFCILLFLVFTISWVYGKSENNDLKMYYNQPASKWLEALPIGNGNLAGMIFGGVAHEHIQFNEESLVTGSTRTVGFYQPFGDLWLDFPDLNAGKYRRELNLTDGIHRVGFVSDGVHYQRESFASYPDKVMVFYLTADKKGRISGKIHLSDAHRAAISVNFKL